MAPLVSRRSSPPGAIRRPIADRSRVPAAYVRATDRDIPDRVVTAYEGAGTATQRPAMPALRRALTADERDALVRRRDDLMAALAAPPNGRHDDRCASAVAGMLAAFRTADRLDIEATVAVVGGYLHVARDYPPWAVIAACEQVRTGESGLNRSYCPHEPEFAAVVRGIIAPYKERLRRTEALLDAAPPDEPAPHHRLAHQPPNMPARPAREELQRRQAEQFLARCKAEAEASVRPAAIDLAEIDPATWND